MSIASSSSAALEVDNISITYPNGVNAIHDASFSIPQGSICALVGMNGSGKSTIFKTIMGFLKPNVGTVKVQGESVIQAQKRCGVAYVPQSEEIDWSFPVSVWDVVMMGRYGFMNFLRIPRSGDREAVTQNLTKVGLLELKDRQIGELSGGQKKRVFLARALAQGAKIILLDEPFTGVDVKTEYAIIDLLRELKSSGHTILVSTHNLGSVPEFCDRAIVINRTVLASGLTSEVFTEQILSKAFGGKLRHFRFNESTVQQHDGKMITVMTDDERPLVFGKDGHLEFTKRDEHQEVIKSRREHEDDH